MLGKASFLLLLIACASIALVVASISDCPQLSSHSAPNDVSQLRPSDIKVVMALGDSITAGFGMLDTKESLLEEVYEYRGRVFSIGGDDEALTLPNYIRHYNPDLTGYSLGKKRPWDNVFFGNFSPIPHEPWIDHLNAAQSSAEMQHLFKQIDYLDEQMTVLEKSGKVNRQTDWKVLTILIAANNLCIICTDDPLSQPSQWAYDLNLVIEKIHQTFPRAFVNLLTMLDISQVYYLSKPGDKCLMFQHLIHECGCLWTDSGRAAISNTTVVYNQIMRDVAAEWQAKELTDFAVVVQPFLEELVLDVGDVSPLDCFHPSEFADSKISMGLWNNMFLPQAKKSHNVYDDVELYCPTDADVFATN